MANAIDTIKNVEKESEEIIETNGLQLACDLCEYKCTDKNIPTKHLDSKHGGLKNVLYAKPDYPLRKHLRHMRTCIPMMNFSILLRSFESVTDQ